MASAATVASVVSELLTLAPKIAAFEAGQAVSLSVPAESYDLDVPDVGKVKISEPGFAVTVQKG